MPRADPVAVWLGGLAPRLRLGFVVGGAMLIHLSLGTYHTFGNMLPYMASYMRNKTDASTTVEKLVWIPMFQGCFPFAMVVGGYASRVLGPRVAASIGCALMSAGVFLSAWTIRHSFWTFLLTYGMMFGLGQGMAYVIAVSCVIDWAPNAVGLVSGLVAAGFGISSSIFAPIQTHLINCENFPTNADGYFTQPALLERVPSVFSNLAIAYAVMQCIGLIVMVDPPQEFVQQHIADAALVNIVWLSRRRAQWVRSGSASTASYANYGYSRLPDARDDTPPPSAPSAIETPRNAPSRSADDSAESRRRAGASTNESDDGGASTDGELGGVASKSESESLTPQEMLRSSTFYYLFAALFCCSFYGNFFYNLYKTFGETFIGDDYFLAAAFSIGSVANAAARIGWGLLTDKTSFQVSLACATVLATLLLLTMPLTVELGQYAFLFWLVLMFVCLGATHALFITAAVRCFGSKYKTANYGFIVFSTTLSGIVLAVGSQFFLQAVGYNWAFIITAAAPFTAFLITISIRVTPQGHLIV